MPLLREHKKRPCKLLGHNSAQAGFDDDLLTGAGQSDVLDALVGVGKSAERLAQYAPDFTGRFPCATLH